MSRFKMRTILCSVIVVLLFAGIASAAAPRPWESFPLSVTPDERDRIHSRIDAFRNETFGPIPIDTGTGVQPGAPLQGMTGVMVESLRLDGRSFGTTYTGVTEYPFQTTNTEANMFQRDRKTAMFDWFYGLARDMGFERVVRHPHHHDKPFYIEIGCPDAPEMIKNFPHMDTVSGSLAGAMLPRWRNEAGVIGYLGTTASRAAYPTPFVQNGWIYGHSISDNRGPGVASYFALKAIEDLNIPLDRRIRLVVGGYEDGGGGGPNVANTSRFMDIAYYTANPSFNCVWTYKKLFREEAAITGFTPDSRFPAVPGNRGAIIRAVTFSLDEDVTNTRPFRLTSLGARLTERPGDPMLQDALFTAVPHVPARAYFTLNVAGAPANSVSTFLFALQAEVQRMGWAGKVGVLPGATTVEIIIDTGYAIEAVTPHYASNAIVWGMHLFSRAFALTPGTGDLRLRQLADSVVEMFMPGGVEDYFGTVMGVAGIEPGHGLYRKLISFGTTLTGAASINGARRVIYPVDTNNFQLDLYMMNAYLPDNHPNADAEAMTLGQSHEAVRVAFVNRGWTIAANPSGTTDITLTASFENPIIRLATASYFNSLNAPTGFDDLRAMTAHRHAAPALTTGGVYSANYFDKMSTIGAIIPGTERWWHAPNDRVAVSVFEQMTKIMADAMVEMARYLGPAGMRTMRADIPGYSSDRADLEMLHVTLATFKDASSAVPPAALGGHILGAATSFDIPMFRIRMNSAQSTSNIARGHSATGIHLPTDDATFLATNYVLPMRLEFKLTRTALNADAAAWAALRNGGLSAILPHVRFGIVRGGVHTELALPSGGNPEQFFFVRAPANDPDSLYLSVNLAITDTDRAGVETVLADSTPDWFRLAQEFVGSPFYLSAEWQNPQRNPWVNRPYDRQVRGFFLFGDGAKNARFTSPQAIYVTIDPVVLTDPETTLPPTPTPTPEPGTGNGGCNTGWGVLMLAAVLLSVRKTIRG